MPVHDYRRLAGKCLGMAEQATHETTRAMLRHSGEIWTRLAEEDEWLQPLLRALELEAAREG
jgi:hypothetical protein